MYLRIMLCPDASAEHQGAHTQGGALKRVHDQPRPRAARRRPSWLLSASRALVVRRWPSLVVFFHGIGTPLRGVIFHPIRTPSRWVHTGLGILGEPGLECWLAGDDRQECAGRTFPLVSRSKRRSRREAALIAQGCAEESFARTPPSSITNVRANRFFGLGLSDSGLDPFGGEREQGGP